MDKKEKCHKVVLDILQKETLRKVSSEEIRNCSNGQVRKPETINSRTHLFEEDGLFCPKIFAVDWDQDEIFATQDYIGHIDLAYPLIHTLYPDYLDTLLETKNIREVIYRRGYLVIDPQGTAIEKHSILSLQEYFEIENSGEIITVFTGTEAIKEILAKPNLEQIMQNGSKERADLARMFLDTKNVILDVLPVIPCCVRSLKKQDDKFITGDLNNLYRRVINRNNRLKRLFDLNAPEVILENEKRMLQQSISNLFCNTMSDQEIRANKIPMLGLVEHILEFGKQRRENFFENENWIQEMLEESPTLGYFFKGLCFFV